MRITAEQSNVLANLDRIVIRTVGETPVPVLDGEDCRLQLFFLCLRGLVAFGAEGEWIRVVDPHGIVGAPGWPAHDETLESPR